MIWEDFNSDKFQHKVDKSRIPVCNIMGVDVAAIDMDWLIDFTREHIKELSGDYMCVSNVHTTVTAYEDESYRLIQNGGILAIPDGDPLSKVGRRRGRKNMKRIAGPSYMGEIFKISGQYGWRHFFYGSTKDTLDKLGSKLKKDYPGLNIVGMYSPPFRELTDREDAEIVNMIKKVFPDFVWVGLGAPKQERWMAFHQGKVSGFMVGVGAGFDYYAGNIKRAPMWMQNSSMEWLYRLVQDPKRLFKRYFYTNMKFIWNAIMCKR